MFDRLAWTVMAYGTEIWGWREKEDIERIGKKYVRWILDVRERTSGYLVGWKCRGRK